ncbi:hypothetical protein K466DRAFT_661932 [Polyporus arcularius HHB13444]|uniref:F-box domain-containing protein n=1 Tax=Polyporus arcularius HHB13444 TaxID=1314778 RepID=A0A5C3PI47_9APHY|nr:hypothetical protein K466DRAFT_661932 [Polyporus arcularius HHB13444]
MRTRESSSQGGREWLPRDTTKPTKDSLAGDLPPEVLGMVVWYLSDEDKRSFSSVCRYFRDLTIPVLFSHLTVRFGSWTPGPPKPYINLEGPLPHYTLKDQHAELARINMDTCGMLRHMHNNPSFARVVKKLTIYAYYIPGRSCADELLNLKQAIQAMPNITSFRWEGRCPLPGAAVLAALANSSGHVLRELYLPSSDDTRACLTNFKQLHTIVLRSPHDVDNELCRADDSQVCVCAGVEANQETLVRLTLHGTAILRCPVRSLLGLQELEMFLPHSMVGLEPIFDHCINLRYVTLDFHADECPQFLELLTRKPGAWPQLTGFKLFYDSFWYLRMLKHAQLAVLVNFLKGKKKLRMLDLANVDLEEGTPSPLLEELRDFTALKVLGLNMRRFRFTLEDISALCTRQFSALLIKQVVDWDIYRWNEMFARLTSVRYLHIIDTGITVDFRRWLLKRPNSLELVGSNTELCWLKHDSERDVPYYLPPWPPSKATFATTDDFGCKDWEWLFRYHARRSFDKPASMLG